MSTNDKTITRIKKTLEQQLELLSTNPGKVSVTELGGVARTLFDIIKREEAIAAERKDESPSKNKDVEFWNQDTDKLLAAMTDEEREELERLYDAVDDFKDGVRRRLDLPVKPVYIARAKPREDLDYFQGLIGQRDEQFSRLVADFINERGLLDQWKAYADSAEGLLATQLKQWFKRQGIYEAFAAICEGQLKNQEAPCD